MNSWKIAAKTLAVISCAVIFASAGRAGEIKGKVSVQGIKSPENIAVYVDAVPGKKFDPPADHVAIDQRKMNFIPHVTVVVQGTTVDFVNSDAVGHNVYWPSVGGNKKLAHNLGTWAKGEKKSFQFSDLGAASLLCNVHPEMNAFLVVVPTPYFAVTDSDGAYEIKDVPAGTYTLKTWSEDGKVTTQPVTVAAGTANADLTVKK
jgi:plastocyanin